MIEELGGYEAVLPIPNSFPQSKENQEFSYVYMSTATDGIEPPTGRWTQGPSLDGRGQFSVRRMTPQGQEPNLGLPRPDGYAQTQQMQGDSKSVLQTIKNKVTGQEG